MISWKSIKTFIGVNSLMVATSLVHFVFTKPSGDFLTDLLNHFAYSLIKNYIIIDFIEYRTSTKNKIMSEQRDLIQNIPKERFYKEFDMFVVSTTLVDSFSQVIIKKIYPFICVLIWNI